MDNGEVVKEVIIHLDDFDINVTGRVVKFSEKEYYWEISHYWRGGNGLTPYVPSKRTFPSQKEAEKFLLSYMVGFKRAEEVAKGSDLVARVIPAKGKPEVRAYPSMTSTGEMIKWAVDVSGAEMPTEYVEEIIETTERSRGLINGGFKIGFHLPSQFGGVGFEFEREPAKETKITTKRIYKRKK